jgi:hypothetical protein
VLANTARSHTTLLRDWAVYLSHSPEEIKDSFRDPEGGSLLAVNEGEIA